MRPTINSLKHIVQQSLDTIPQGTVVPETVMFTVPVVDGGTSTEIREGCTVKAVYIEKWLRGADNMTASTYVLIVEKIVNAGDSANAGEMGALHTYKNKKNILFTSMGLINNDDSTATPVLRNWIPIPKGKQRFGAGDSLRITIFAQVGEVARCGLTIYKEYF